MMVAPRGSASDLDPSRRSQLGLEEDRHALAVLRGGDSRYASTLSADIGAGQLDHFLVPRLDAATVRQPQNIANVGSAVGTIT